MFKYLRTMNNGCESPEILEIDTNYSQSYIAGSICTCEETGTLTNTIMEGAPKYLTLSAKPKNTSGTVKCMKILPGMVFEADGASDPGTFRPGARGSFSKNENDNNCYFAAIGNDMEILKYPISNNVDKVLITIL